MAKTAKLMLQLITEMTHYSNTTNRVMHDPVHHLSTRLVIFVHNIQCDNELVPLLPKLQIHLCATDGQSKH